MEYEEGDITIGIVDKIVGTSVFIKLEKGEGVINFSEVAPGRIRNIRDYINPGQKLVLKILRIDEEKKHIDLSLRRVTQKEKKETLENERKEVEFLTLLKIATKDEKKSREIFEKIKLETPILQFFEDFSEKSEKEILSSMKNSGLNEIESKTIYLMLKDKIKEKKVNIKKELSLHSESENGVDKIKNVLSIKKDKMDIRCIGAPLYTVSIEDKDYKEANKKMKGVLDEIARKAKQEGCILEIKQDK